MNKALLGLALCFFAAVPCASAEEFYCEVMALEGTATLSNQTQSGKPLQEGDILRVDDVIEVGSNSYVDLAYDREWNNVTRLEENSKIRIRSLFPTELGLESGGVYAKLKRLPKDSSFDVQTPTAIASVRGTEYRTTFTDGETQIFNVSDSDVYVYGLDAGGQKQSEPVILKNSQRSEVPKRGMAPVAPHRMATADFHPVERAREHIENKIKQNIAQGHFGKTPDIQHIERMREQGMGGKGERHPVKTLSGDEAGAAAQRVVDGETPQGHPLERERQEQRRMENGPGQRQEVQQNEHGGGQPYGPDAGRKPEPGQHYNPEGSPPNRSNAQGGAHRQNNPGNAKRQGSGPAHPPR